MHISMCYIILLHYESSCSLISVFSWVLVVGLTLFAVLLCLVIVFL